MAYRALLTITDNVDTAHYLVLLGDGFEEGEKAAHLAAGLRDFKTAQRTLNEGKVQPRYFASEEACAEWIETYADQCWTVTFNPDAHEAGESHFVTVRIEGLDSAGTIIFLRRTTYHVEAA
jgi:hypothetical protein